MNKFLNELCIKGCISLIISSPVNPSVFTNALSVNQQIF